MRAMMLLVGLVLLVSSIVIIFTETKRETLGVAVGAAVIAGFCFRISTEDDI
jgi:hypothetical protein